MRSGRIRWSARHRDRRAAVAMVGALAIGAATLGLAGPSAAQTEQPAPAAATGSIPLPSSSDAGGVIVRFRDTPDFTDAGATRATDAQAALDEVTDEPGDVQVLPSGSVRVAVDPARVDAVVAELSARDDVEWAEPEAMFHADATPNDPELAAQWHLPAVHAPQAWDHTTGAGTVRVAVIDSAIDTAHPDLAGKVVSTETVYSSWCPTPASHGTAVAGVIAAATNNGVNVAGVGWNTSIIGIEALCNGSGPPAAVYAAIVRAVELDVDVINLSLGSPTNSSDVAWAVQYAQAQGIVIVASAGNEGGFGQMYPAALDRVIAVAATDPTNNISYFSNRGSWVEIAAPGSGIHTLCNRLAADCPGTTNSVNGTSFAAPIVSAAVALLRSREPNISIEAVRARLAATSQPIAGTGSLFAWGLLDIERFITARGGGYAMVTTNGAVDAFGDAYSVGELEGIRLNLPIVGAAATPSRFGYWMVATDGGIFSFGNAQFFGSTGNIALNQPIVGMASTPSGNGYRMVASDGGIFAFGDAGFFGSTGAITLNQPIVGMASTPSGNGYWLVARDGGIFAFGDAVFRGSTGAIRLNQPIVGMASTPSGSGYWLVASDGGIFAFGDAAFYGSTGAISLNQPITAMASTSSGSGYWMVARDGGIFAFGDAAFYGSSAGRHFTSTVSLLVA